MKNSIYLSLFFLIILGCQTQNTNFRQDFSERENRILNESRNIIKNSYFGSFVSINNNDFPKIRVVEPISPDKEFIIYFATKPNTRKVKEIDNHPKTAFHFFDKSQLAYVSLYGKSGVISDKNQIKKHWNPAWDRYYPDKQYVLIKFVPEFLEMVNIQTGLTGNDKNWMPERVELRK